MIVIIPKMNIPVKRDPQEQVWGHSTWLQGVKVAKAARVKKFILFHHDPAHDDNFIDELEREARKEFKESYTAYEGMELNL